MKNWLEEYVGKRCDISMKNVDDSDEGVTLLASNEHWIKVLDNEDILLIQAEQITSIRVFIV